MRSIRPRNPGATVSSSLTKAILSSPADHSIQAPYQAFRAQDPPFISKLFQMRFQ